MRYIKTIILFIFLINLSDLKAQRAGRLSVDFTDYPVDFLKDKVCLKLYLNDTLCSTKYLLDYQRVHFKNLVSGKYDLSVFRNDIKDVTYYGIDVDTLYGSSHVDISFKNFKYTTKYRWEEDSIDEHYTDKKSFNHPYQSANILKGVPIDNKSTAIDAEFQFSYTFGFYLFKRKYFDIPFEFGFNSGFAHIRGDTTFFIAKPKNTERNFYFNTSFALYNSINLFHDSLSKYSKCTIQYGIAYNFPFVYNHVGIDSTTRYVHRSISNYTNVYVVGRILFGKEQKLGIQAEYNLNPYIKKGYAEPAIFRAGLVFKVSG